MNTLNAMHSTPAIKGIHLAMKSGMLAAETIMDALGTGSTNRHALGSYTERLAGSWAGEELREGRNFAQALAKKMADHHVANLADNPGIYAFCSEIGGRCIGGREQHRRDVVGHNAIDLACAGSCRTLR